MEEDIYKRPIESGLLQRASVQREIEKLEHAAEEAAEKISIEAAHNPEIRYALDIVERFLREKKRVCYGGTAINSILPPKLRFYDPQRDLPDYDFFTPEPEKDIQSLVRKLQKAGFLEVNERIGMHKGTHKILVNFLPIADITYLDMEIYKKILERSIVKAGIHYCDPDFLRMMMYLELSRPKGQVERWKKVYERLILLNTSFPPGGCGDKKGNIRRSVAIPGKVRTALLEFLVAQQRVFAGAAVTAFYQKEVESSSKKKEPTRSLTWFTRKRGLFVFISPNLLSDAIQIAQILGEDNLRFEEKKSDQEMIPSRLVLYYKKKPLALIVQEQACHSYIPVKVKEGGTLLLASIPTLLTLYYSLNIFTNDEWMFQESILCLCNKLVEMNNRIIQKGNTILPAFSITCQGYQKGYASLLREKVVRIEEQKRAMRAMTYKNKRTSQGKTLRSRD
jgi:hypothetical protein